MTKMRARGSAAICRLSATLFGSARSSCATGGRTTHVLERVDRLLDAVLEDFDFGRLEVVDDAAVARREHVHAHDVGAAAERRLLRLLRRQRDRGEHGRQRQAEPRSAPHQRFSLSALSALSAFSAFSALAEHRLVFVAVRRHLPQHHPMRSSSGPGIVSATFAVAMKSTCDRSSSTSR